MNRRKTRFNYVILSDLHLSEGKKKATGQISRFEGFLFDRPFERLLLHLQERAEQRDHLWTLVFNGDLIDFLRITSIPDPNHPPKGLPLPFISYGGTSLLINMLAVGVLLNIYIVENEAD